MRKRAKCSSYQRSLSLAESIQKCNQAVLENLGLAHLAATRQATRGTEELDDLIQEARLGLIMAMERFDANRGFKISSYAMARANGQILHFRRDKSQIVRVPWRLRDLYTRGMRLQQVQLNDGLNPLTEEQLTAKLDVSPDRWHKAVEAVWQTRLVALDARGTSTGGNHAEKRVPLLELLKSPKQKEPDLQHQWLKKAMQRLTPKQQQLLYSHYIDDISLRQLAKREKIKESMLRSVLRGLIKQLQLWSSTNLMNSSSSQSKPSADCDGKNSSKACL